MRVLIIDDEISTRESIKMLGDFSEESGDQIYEAKNGAEGYHMIRSVDPQLIFLDMNMPVMDGADLLDMLDENNFPAKIIVVSGYTDFRYTKAAILKNYVVDYIQKPIDEKQLLGAIWKATGKNRAGILKKDKEKETKKQGMLGIFVESFPQILQTNYTGSMDLFRYFLQCQLERQTGEIQAYEAQDEIYQYGFFFSYTPQNTDRIKERLKDLVSTMEKRSKIRSYILYLEKITGNLKKTYMEMCDYFNYAPWEEDVRVLEMRDVVRIPENRFEAGTLAGDLIRAGTDRNQERFHEITKNAAETLHSKNCSSIYERKIILSDIIYETGRRLKQKGIYIDSLISSMMEELYSGKYLFSAEFSEEWLERLEKEIWRVTEQKAEEIPEDFQRILHYIQQNYSSKLNLSELSKMFYFNISTLSRMFVKYKGINYVEYINTLRLEKARELLEESRMSVSEIGENTGFDSLSYFSKQFKKKYGVSPQDYRKSI